MALIVGVNTYFDLDEANNIMATEFTSKSREALYWDELTEDKDKEVIIKRTTALMDRLCYLGYKGNYENQLNWPRIISGRLMDIPDDLKIAILTQGIRNEIDLEQEETRLRQLGVKKYTTAEASIEFIGGGNESVMYGIYQDIYESYVKSWIY